MSKMGGKKIQSKIDAKATSVHHKIHEMENLLRRPAVFRDSKLVPHYLNLQTANSRKAAIFT